MRKPVFVFEVIGAAAILITMKLMLTGVFAIMNANIASLLG